MFSSHAMLKLANESARSLPRFFAVGNRTFITKTAHALDCLNAQKTITLYSSSDSSLSSSPEVSSAMA